MSNYLNYFNSTGNSFNSTGNSFNSFNSTSYRNYRNNQNPFNYAGISRFYQTLEYDGTKENLEENVDALCLITSSKSLIDMLKLIKDEIIKNFRFYGNYKYIFIRAIKIVNTSERAKGTYYYFDDKLKPVTLHKSHIQILYILILTFLIIFLIFLVVCYYYKIDVVKYVDIYGFF